MVHWEAAGWYNLQSDFFNPQFANTNMLSLELAAGHLFVFWFPLVVTLLFCVYRVANVSLFLFLSLEQLVWQPFWAVLAWGLGSL